MNGENKATHHERFIEDPSNSLNKGKVDVSYRRKTKEEHRKEKELEEARKAGTALPELDEEGKMINPHIPHYISKVPWYYGEDTATLKHQRVLLPSKRLKSIIKSSSQQSFKRQKGGCANCGAMDHIERDCLERPSAKGRKSHLGLNKAMLGKNGAREDGAAFDSAVDPDEVSYDQKRDRWGNYDPAEYIEIHKTFQQIDDLQQKMKEDKIKSEMHLEDKDTDLADIDKDKDKNSDEGLKYAEDADMVGAKFDSKKRITIRNLRIRNDTAKYLINLDLSSAYYDPKTRSMREDPYIGLKKRDPTYVSENFIRQSGDVATVAQAQVLAWQQQALESKDKGDPMLGTIDFNIISNPTASERALKNISESRVKKADEVSKRALTKYDISEEMHQLPPEISRMQSSTYKEYDLQGNLLVGAEPDTPRSKYNEDVLTFKHTEIFGSYYYEGNWGYACCHALLYHSYCTGDVGKRLNQAALLSGSH